jgi:hypothetical protein
MYRIRNLVYLLALALLVPGAAFAVNTGGADFTNYVAAGDSLTAGFFSGSLIDTSQKVDYPALIAAQAGVADFEQPLVSPPGIPNVLTLRGLFPTVIAPAPGQGVPENLNLPRLYNNLAVPGETLSSMINIESDTQVPPHTPGLHDLILRGFGTQLEEVVGSKPTFVTLWIGNNDALGAATSGNVGLLTPLATFEAEYTIISGAIAQTGATMAIANIPDVTSIPFVTTIPIVLVNPATNEPVLVGGQPVPLIGPKGLLVPGDNVLLPASADLAKGLGIPVAAGGTGLPLPASDVLLAADAATINARVGQFNSFIQGTASSLGAAYVDANSILAKLATDGIEVGGISFSAAFLTGGVFGYDGVHPTHFGYAYIANAFIDAINATFAADIPEVDLFAAVFSPNAAAPAVPDMVAARAALHQTVWTRFLFTAAAAKNLEAVLTPKVLPSKGGHRKP